MNEEYISKMIFYQESIFLKYKSLNEDIERVKENIFRYNRIMIVRGI